MGKIKLPRKKDHIKRRTFFRVLLVLFYLRETLRCVVCVAGVREELVVVGSVTWSVERDL